MTIRKLLCPVDLGSHSAAGLAPAVSIATENGGEIELLHVLTLPYPQLQSLGPSFDVEAYYDELEVAANERMDELLDAETRRFVTVTTQVRRGVPYVEIVAAAAEGGHDAVCLPTHGTTGLTHLFFGSTTDKVIRLAPCPVLAVHPAEGGDGAAFEPRTIVMPTDFSSAGNSALPLSLELARTYQARLVLLHVVTLWEADQANPDHRFPAVTDAHREAAMELADNQLGEMVSRVAGVNVETRIVRGFNPADDIVRSSREDLDADLVVMATHGHTGLTRALLGSVTERVARTFDGPVFTVRAADSD